MRRKPPHALPNHMYKSSVVVTGSIVFIEVFLRFRWKPFVLPAPSLLPAPSSLLFPSSEICEKMKKKRGKNGGNGKETVSKRNDKETKNKKRKRNGKQTTKNRFKKRQRIVFIVFCSDNTYTYIYIYTHLNGKPPSG